MVGEPREQERVDVRPIEIEQPRANDEEREQAERNREADRVESHSPLTPHQDEHQEDSRQ